MQVDNRLHLANKQVMAAILQRAKEIVGTPETCSAFHLATNADQKPVDYRAPGAVNFSALGAVHKATWEINGKPKYITLHCEHSYAMEFLDNAAGQRMFCYELNHTHEQLMLTFDKAIAACQ